MTRHEDDAGRRGKLEGRSIDQGRRGDAIYWNTNDTRRKTTNIDDVCDIVDIIDCRIDEILVLVSEVGGVLTRIDGNLEHCTNRRVSDVERAR